MDQATLLDREVKYLTAAQLQEAVRLIREKLSAQRVARIRVRELKEELHRRGIK